MPKYTFTCHTCGDSRQEYVPVSVKDITCGRCDSAMIRQMPILADKVEVKELIDSHQGVSWKEDQQKLVKDRKRTYFWEIEVPRMVASGIYSLETMLENKWVYYDDKGNLVTRTNPPEAE